MKDMGTNSAEKDVWYSTFPTNMSQYTDIIEKSENFIWAV